MLAGCPHFPSRTSSSLTVGTSSENQLPLARIHSFFREVCSGSCSWPAHVTENGNRRCGVANSGDLQVLVCFWNFLEAFLTISRKFVAVTPRNPYCDALIIVTDPREFVLGFPVTPEGYNNETKEERLKIYISLTITLHFSTSPFLIGLKIREGG